MSMQPGDPIVGGVTLRRAAIQSPNYVPGVQGWAINADGTAEFRSITLPGSPTSISSLTNGTLNATGLLGSGAWQTANSGTRLVMNGSGLQLFSGATPTVTLDASTGNATFTGTVSASTVTGSTISGGSISGAAVTAGTITGTSISGGSISGASITGGTVIGATVETASSGQRVVLNTAGTIDLTGSLGNTGQISVNAIGQLIMSAGGVSLSVGGAGGGINSSFQVTGSVTGASAFFVGSMSSASVNTGSGAVTCGDVNSSGTVNTSTVHATTLNVGVGTDTVIVGQASGTVALGATTVNVSNIPTGTGTAIVESGRQLFIQSSSLRFKDDVKDADIDPQEVLKLRPITYRDKGRENSPEFFGVIAEEIANGPLDRLVYRDENGLPSAVAYDRLGVLLIPVVRELLIRVQELEERLA